MSRTARDIRTVETPNFFEVEDVDKAVDLLAERIIALAEETAGRRNVRSVCVAFPGPVDSMGNIRGAPTVWGRQADLVIPFKQILSKKRTTWRIELINDVAAAGYNYVTPDRQDFLIVTVGSGIGSKLFLGGKPVIGASARGGEIGHLKFDFSDAAPLCDCGERGHIGAVSSGRGVLRRVRQAAADDPDRYRASRLFSDHTPLPKNITNTRIVKAFLGGDAWTRDLIEYCARPLAHSFASIHLHCGVEDFIVVGGFAQALGKSFADMLGDLAGSMTWRDGLDWRNAIHHSEATDHSGVNGAHKFLQSINLKAASGAGRMPT